MRGAATEEQLAQALRGVLAPMGRLAVPLHDHGRVSRYAAGCSRRPLLGDLLSRPPTVNKKNAVETVTAMWDGDAWRVSGYYIR